MTIFEMSISASLLILAIVIIRSLAIHTLPKVTFMVLWGVALSRLFIPFSLISPFHNFAAFDGVNNYLAQPSSLSVVSLSQVSTIQQIVNPTQPASTLIFINPNLILIVWVIGLIACALFFLIPHFSSRQDYQTALPIDHPVIAKWLKSHKMIRSVQIKQLDRISAPFTYGVFRPVILLPKGMDWTDEKQLEYVLTHEFTHIKRMDTVWKWLLAASLCIHWFNPLVWVMYVLANRDIELSCDETVVRSFGATQKSSYALTLIGMEERRNLQTLLVNNFSKDAIKERIDAIMKLKKVTPAGITSALLLVIILITACATTGPIGIGKSKPGNGNSLKATALPQNSSATQVGITAVNGNALKAMPVPSSVIDISDLVSKAKSISDAKNLIKSTSPKDQSRASSYSSIVIKFNQDMDASTLNGNNIIVVDEKHSTIVTYAFNFNYHEETRELHLDMKPEMKPTWKQASSLGIGTGNIVHVFLTKNIKRADGQSIDDDYVFSYRT